MPGKLSVTAAGPPGRLLLLLLASAAAGCFQSPPSKESAAPTAAAPASPSPASTPLPSDPSTRQARIVEIATDYAVGKGMARDSIRVTSVKEANGLARVAFEKEPRRPGSHFTVIVDAASGKITDFRPGM